MLPHPKLTQELLDKLVEIIYYQVWPHIWVVLVTRSVFSSANKNSWLKHIRKQLLKCIITWVVHKYKRLGRFRYKRQMDLKRDGKGIMGQGLGTVPRDHDTPQKLATDVEVS